MSRKRKRGDVDSSSEGDGDEERLAFPVNREAALEVCNAHHVAFPTLMTVAFFWAYLLHRRNRQSVRAMVSGRWTAAIATTSKAEVFPIIATGTTAMARTMTRPNAKAMTKLGMLGQIGRGRGGQIQL